MLKSTRVLALDVRQGAPQQLELFRHAGRSGLPGGRGHIEGSLPIRDLGCGTSGPRISPAHMTGDAGCPARRAADMDYIPTPTIAAVVHQDLKEQGTNESPGRGVGTPYGLPAVLDVPDAARMLGIGRTLAYELVRTNQWPTPVIRVGRLIKIPSVPLLELIATGALTPSTVG